MATGALFVGFAALDAPARTRAGWQAAVTPLVALAAALGAFTGHSPALAVPTMAVVGAIAGYGFAVSPRLAIAGLTVALSLLISQGLEIPISHAPEALLFAGLGGVLQVAFSLAVYAAGDRGAEKGENRWDVGAARRNLSANFTLDSTAARHALRFGTAMAAGVAAYWLLDLHQHGFWIPLTILFVLRPEAGETNQRLVLRAAGTAIGLVIATALSFWLEDDGIALAVALTMATAVAYGTLTVQYAIFTTGITTYAVLLADTLGEPALEAAGQRAYGTAIGIAISALAFLLWSNPGRGEGERPDDTLSPPEAAAR
ncbi:MAG: FUSC family protein [Solirubrobacterales bacterium]